MSSSTKGIISFILGMAAVFLGSIVKGGNSNIEKFLVLCGLGLIVVGIMQVQKKGSIPYIKVFSIVLIVILALLLAVIVSRLILKQLYFKSI